MKHFTYHDLRALAQKEWKALRPLPFEEAPYYVLAELLRRFRGELDDEARRCSGC